MPDLILKITGYKEINIGASWETHIVDSTLDNLFSGIIDGFSVNLWTINSFDPAVIYRKSGVDMNIGDQFNIDDINNGIIVVEYLHGVSASGTTNFTITGAANYDINFTINSTI